MIAAKISILPPQCSHFSMSIPNTRLRSFAQDILLDLTAVLLGKIEGLADRVKDSIEALDPQSATTHVLDLLNDANKYIGDRAPWKQVKTDLPAAAETLGACLEVLRVAGILWSPIMPGKCSELLKVIGWEKTPSLDDARKTRACVAGASVLKPEPLFPRVEWKADAG
jgi:methionyl-tRNA synthetase